MAAGTVQFYLSGRRMHMTADDAPWPENDQEDHQLLIEAAGRLFSSDDRRELSLRAIRDLMGHFQTLYRVVSTEYSELRSELMTAH
jgi:hypothetical protein